MRPSTSVVVAAAAFAATVHGALVEKWYDINRVTTNPDGMFDKIAVGVNGTWPPPILEVHANDTVRIHATNALGTGETTSIHHHGMFFNGTGYYDGAPGITQCGIPPNQTLTYEVPVDRQHNSYWWHSHNGDQYMDGLRAPFIIHPDKEAHEYDEEMLVILGDWYHEPSKVMNKQFMSKFNPTGAEPVPQSALVYFAKNGSYLPSNDNVLFNENASLPFEPNKTYRLRVFNTGSFAMLFMWIDGHQMRVIEMDGVDVEEFPVDKLTMSVAQRYSVLVTTKNTTDSNYMMHVNFDYTMFDQVPEDLKLNYTATVSYGEGLPLAPEEVRYDMDLMEDHLMVPVEVKPQLVPTKNLTFTVTFDTYSDGSNRAAFNDITFQMPKTPTLFSMLSMGNESLLPQVYGPQTHAVVLEKFDVVNLKIVNADGNAHPFHLHGTSFQVTRVSTNDTSEDPEINPVETFDNPNPSRRDVIIVPGEGGAVNIQWVANNPGAWILHCHIDWHMTAGLAMVFIEAPTEAQQILQVPQVMKDHCAALGIASEGNAAGKFSVTDLDGAPHGPYPQVLGWKPKGIVALVGTIVAALLGMAAVVWYALGGQLEEDELDEQVRHELEKKKEGGLIKRNIKKAVRRS
ncbi:ferroxidase fet3 [Microbotryomycetes sp. JL221]|nr:ferroxidase fet3 [Microbotryomycetes sp. JL221]